MQLTTQAIIRISEALQHFDKPAEPYKIAGPVRMAMAKNLSRLNEVMNAYVAERNRLIRDLAAGGNQVPGDKMGEFETKQQMLLDAQHDVNLIRFREEQFQLEANPVPVWVLTALMPIMIVANNDDEGAVPAGTAVATAAPSVR